MKRRNHRVALLLACLALVATALLSPTAAFAATFAGETNSSSSDSSERDSSRGVRTVPHWTSSFTDPTNGVTYPFTMVGSDPRLRRSTTVATKIIPLKFTFVAGNQDVSVLKVPTIPSYVPTPLAVSMNGADNVADTIASPIFTPSDFPISGDSGVQFGDAFARAQFGKLGTNYHVRLGQPRVAKAVSIKVPQSKGVALLNPAGVLMGLVDSNWFRERLAKLIKEMDLKPTILPIFLTNNVVLYQDGTYLHCCTLGGHGAGSPASSAPISLTGHKEVSTFVFAAYIKPHTFPPPFVGVSDIHSLSHEIAEWIDDPFGINVVRPYRVPLAPPGACASQLEIGDPLIGVWFPLPRSSNPADGVWHPQDVIFLNWFARDGEAPGLAPADGRYTFAGPMTTGLGGPFIAFTHAALACLASP